MEIAIWKYINSKCKTSEGVSDLKKDTKNPKSPVTTSDKEKAEVLGQFFTTVFVEEPDGNIPLLDTRTLRKGMEIKGIISGYVWEVLGKLDGNKSMGPYGLHPRFLKELSGYLSTPLVKYIPEITRRHGIAARLETGKNISYIQEG